MEEQQANDNNTPQNADQRRENNEKIVALIQEKIKELNTNFNFSMQYHDIIQKIFTNLEEQTYEKINNSLNDCFGYLNFFKDSSELYSKFAEQIQNCNKAITFTNKKPKIGDDFLSTLMQSTQNIFHQNLAKFSNGLKMNIINKGPLSKLQEKKGKIELARKNHSKKYSELKDEKKNLDKKFRGYFKIIFPFVPELADQYSPPNKRMQVDPMPELIDSPDFVIIVKDILDSLNALTTKVNAFVTDTKNSMLEVNNVFTEVNALIRESVSIYIGESKSFFNSEVTKKLEEIEAYFKKYDENTKDKNKFQISKIFQTEQARQTFITLLQQYHGLISNSNLVKKELVEDKTYFSLEKHQTLDAFFDWFLTVLPKNFEVPINDLINKQFQIQRDPGPLYKWKDAFIVFTKQHHLLLLDKVESYKNEDIVKIFETDKITFKKRVDKKRPYAFEVVAVMKGKIMNFKGETILDALGDPNLNAIKELIDNQA